MPGMNEGSLLVGFVTLQRLAELALAHRNTRLLLGAGGIEFGRAHYWAIMALHAGWLGGLWVLGHDRPVDRALLVVFLVLQCARIWVIASLGRRWTTRIIVLAGEPHVGHGPYRIVRHPNYLIVALEIAVVPLALGLPLYAALFFVLNTVLLGVRIRAENAALAWAADAAKAGAGQRLAKAGESR
jgi:methyltransferase